LAGLTLAALLAAACGGGGGAEPTATGTTTVGPATPTPLATTSPVASPEMPVPQQELERAIRGCLGVSRTYPGDRSGIEDCLLDRPRKPLGFAAQVFGVEGLVPVLLIDLANPHCSFDEFVAWWSGDQWQLQYMNPLFRADISYRIGPWLPAKLEMPVGREAAAPEGARLGIVTSAANCGSAPHASFLLLTLDGDSWRILWDAQDSQMAELAHTKVQFVGEGIDSIAVRGSSWHLRDPQRGIFHESNAGPHRYFNETWILKGEEYVLAEKRVQPSVYNTLVEFIYRLSTGDETGAATLLTDPTLLEKAKTLGLVQNPLGQEWSISLDRNAECCGPVRILKGLSQRVAAAVWFSHQGEDWLISDIKPE
jgi:hypothetical protein